MGISLRVKDAARTCVLTFLLQVDAEQYYSELEEKRTDEFNAEKNRITMKRLGIAFVTFRDERMTAVWVQHDTEVYVRCHSMEQLLNSRRDIKSMLFYFTSCFVFQHCEGLRPRGLPSHTPAVQHHHCGSVVQMGGQLCTCSQWHHLVSTDITGTHFFFLLFFWCFLNLYGPSTLIFLLLALKSTSCYVCSTQNKGRYCMHPSIIYTHSVHDCREL